MSPQLAEFEVVSQLSLGFPCVGRIVEILKDGHVFVDFPGNKLGPIRARLAAPVLSDEPDQSVLLVFENQDASLPVIASVIGENNQIFRVTRAPNREELILESDKELTLVCGKSSITLRGDGRIIIKGAEIISRASGAHKIRGASVKIN